MIVCHCEGVNDHTIREAVGRGARCPETVAALCGAGALCGGCRPAIEDVVDRMTAAGEHGGQSGRGRLRSA